MAHQQLCLHILLDGPQGCRKTVVARAIATSPGLQFVFFNCGAVVEAIVETALRERKLLEDS